MAEPKPITANDLTEMLRRHYLPENRPPSGFFAAEVESPNGKRRADALWVSAIRSSPYGLVGHELKVSRSDLLVELADPAKCDPWMQYCDQWWLVISDPALIDGLDIPENWGIMAPPSGRLRRSMTVLRPGPRLHPIDQAPGLRRLLSWQMHHYGSRTANAEYQMERERRESESLRRQLADRANVATHVHPETKRISDLIRQAQSRLRANENWAPIEDEVIVMALADAAATRDHARSLRRRMNNLLRDLEGCLKQFDLARADAERAAQLGLAELDALTEDEFVILEGVKA